MGWPWSAQEKTWHINCLELLVASLALKAFVRDRTKLSVLLKIDNTTAVTYINNQGGAVSKKLTSLTRDLWMWCLERNIHIQAQHLSGIQNCIANKESRSMRDYSDWKLDPQTFAMINRRYGPLEVDLFASRLTNQCQRYYSWRPDPFAEAIDAFLQDWSRVKGFCQSLLELDSSCIEPDTSPGGGRSHSRPIMEGSTMVCLIASRLATPPAPSETVGTRRRVVNRPTVGHVELSGKASKAKALRSRLQASLSSPGGPRETSLMTHSSSDGIAGVVSGVPIPFQDL